ncbi:MAG: sigma-70 family RNA polymerase sigma factor [Phycisphaerae bacterium]|nr:sigma-70 family RNA polymerase sigma factor [Phycisphaerae bacterium]
MESDITLVQGCLDGSALAFEAMVSRYQALVCAITYSAAGNRAVSEDLAQETFVQAWKKLGQLKEPEKFRPWLCSIARNIVRQHLHIQKQMPEVRYDMSDIEAKRDGQSPPETLIRQEEEAMVHAALLHIPEEYREPLVLFYRQDQSVRQVAELMGLTEATTRTRLHRARQMLREQVESRIETTLKKTAPGPAFTRSVLGAVGMGLAAGIAGTATAAGAGKAAGGLLAGIQAKVIAAGAVAVIGTCTMVALHHFSDSEPIDTDIVQSQEHLWEPQGPPPMQSDPAALSGAHIVTIEAPDIRQAQGEIYQSGTEPVERVETDDFDAWLESIIMEYVAMDNSATQLPETAALTGGMTGGMMYSMGMGGISGETWGGDAFASLLRETIIDFSPLTADMTLGAAIEYIHIASEFPLHVVILWQDLQTHSAIDRDTPIGIDGLGHMTAESGLNAILNSVSAGRSPVSFAIDDGVLLISAEQSLPKTFQNVAYPIGDLLLELGNPFYEVIKQDIIKTYAPSSWHENGGEGRIDVVGGDTLLVWQTPQVHTHIQYYLIQTREAFGLSEAPIDIPPEMSEDYPVLENADDFEVWFEAVMAEYSAVDGRAGQ